MIRFFLRQTKALLTALLCIVAATAHADFPSKPLTMVIPFAPGGTNDIVGRLIAKELSGLIGQQVVPENRTGGGGIVGWTAVARAPADGHTLLSLDMSYSIAAGLLSKIPFDPRKDFVPIAIVASTPFVMVVKADYPANSVSDFVQSARKNPGKMNYGSAGNGTNSHLAAEVFKANNALSLTHVPYKGASAVLQDLISGQIDVLFTAMPTALPMIKGGRLKALMVTSPERVNQLPDVPAAPEAGQQGMVMDFWAGAAAPGGTPPAIVHQLNKAVVDAINRPEAKRTLAELGLFPVLDTPEEARKKVVSEIDRWSAVIKAAKITTD